jgi:hypothetical protein
MTDIDIDELERLHAEWVTDEKRQLEKEKSDGQVHD